MSRCSVMSSLSELLRKGFGSLIDVLKSLAAPLPFQALKTETKGVAIGRGNDRAGLRRTALRVRIVKPHTKAPKGGSYVVETHINVAFRVVAVFRDDVRPRAGQESDRQLTDSYVEVLDASSITTHV